MRKYLIVLVIAATSCDKSYTCKCVDNTRSGVTVETQEYKEKNKQDAEGKCASRQLEWRGVAFYKDVTCNVQ